MKHKGIFNYILLYFLLLIMQFILIITVYGNRDPFPKQLITGFIIYTILSAVIIIIGILINTKMNQLINEVVKLDNKENQRKGLVRLYRINSVLSFVCTCIMALVFSLPIGSYQYYHQVWVYRTIKIDSSKDLQQVCQYPRANYVLTKDLDLSKLEVDKAYIDCIFEGTFNGKSHIISHSNQPFINENRGTVKNIQFQSVNINGDENIIGAVAKINYFNGLIEKMK
jgi:nitrogen fixation/metabolism regulation signal transduction histidine kinase